MEELEVCRVCLARDVKMRLIANTPLQEVYEGLTRMPLKTKDRSTQVCYICCAALQNCYRLRQRCLQTEELFAKHVLKMVNIQKCLFAPRLTLVHPVFALSMNGKLRSVTGQDTSERWDVLTKNVKMEKTGTECIEIKTEEDSLEENVADISSQSADNISPKVDEVFENIIRKETKKGASVVKKQHLAPQKKSTEMTHSKEQIKDDLSVHKNVDKTKERFLGKPILRRKINKSKDKVHTHKDNKGKSTHDKYSKRPSKSNIEKAPLGSHTRKHTGEKLFHCNLCVKSYFAEPSLLKHMQKHTDKINYTCDLCKKTYLYKTSLKRHIRKHIAEGQNKCKTCNKIFFQKADLKSHVCDKSERSVMCKLCNRLIIKYHFKSHMSIHTGEKRYMCDVCSKCFIQQTTLKRHMRTHTGEKTHMCDVCKKCFSGNDKLRKHSRTHTGEKPYVCNVCKKSFSCTQHLNRHRLLHSGEKPYACEECDKRFTQKSNLMSHTRTHTGEKPYSCDVCKTCFSNNSSLKIHSVRHNKNK